jgi:hypothetical protein
MALGRAAAGIGTGKRNQHRLPKTPSGSAEEKIGELNRTPAAA